MAELTEAQVAVIVEKALAERDEAHSAEIAALQARLDAQQAAAAAAGVLTFVPEHAGGPGAEIAETWSQAEQTAARIAADAARG